MNIPFSLGAFRPVHTLSALCLVLLTSVISGCGDEKSKAESDFIRDCKTGGGTTALCGCIYDRLLPQYPKGELLKMSQEYGYVPPGFMNNMLNAAQHCRKQ
jgi:hypothetical protein